MRTILTLPICTLICLWTITAHAYWLYQVIDIETNESHFVKTWPQQLGANQRVIVIPDQQKPRPQKSTTLIGDSRRWLTANQKRLALLAEDLRSKKVAK
jgi:hypothetical protein